VRKLGVVIDVNGLKIKFRISEGAVVERGQLCKVVSNGVKYVLKVVDFRPETLLSTAEIARLSKRVDYEEAELDLVYDGVRIFNTAIATLVCEISDDGTVHKPLSSPPLFSEVYEVDENDLKQLNLSSGDLAIGTVRLGRRATSIPVTLNGSKAFPHHVLICAATGGGKTNLAKVLSLAVMNANENSGERKYSLIVFDCEAEYFDGGDPSHLGLVHSPLSEKWLYLISNRVSRPCKLKYVFRYGRVEVERYIEAHPLAIPYSELRPEDMVLTGDFTPAQEELMWLAWKVKESDWLSFLLNSAPDTIFCVLRKEVHKNTILTLKRKLKYFLGHGEVFRQETEHNLIPTLLEKIAEGKVVLIEVTHLSEGEEKLLATVIASRIFKFYEGTRKRKPDTWIRLPTVGILVEEAHRYLSKELAERYRENIFSVIAKRGRKYRVGLILITQMPGELHETVIRQSLTKIILPLPTKPDYSKVIHYSPYLDESENEIKTLERGEALVVSTPSGYRFAVPVKVYRFEDLVLDQLNAEIKLRELMKAPLYSQSS